MKSAYKVARKAAVAVIGFTVIAAGAALLVLPGPGVLVIIAGLAILALEFEWAERHMKKLKKHAKALPKKLRSRKNT